jgi:hypothetical protein
LGNPIARVGAVGLRIIFRLNLGNSKKSWRYKLAQFNLFEELGLPHLIVYLTDNRLPLSGNKGPDPIPKLSTTLGTEFPAKSKELLDHLSDCISALNLSFL